MIHARLTAIMAVLLATSACEVRDADSNGNSGATSPESGAGLVKRGRYLASIMDCAGCHNRGSFSPKPDEGPLEGGTIGFEVPGLGIFYPPNLTSHPEAGLGRWSAEDIVRAVREGKRPDGRELAPAMPWHAYSALNDQDAAALAAFLKSLPPSPNRVPGPATKDTAPRPYMTVAPPAASQGA